MRFTVGLWTGTEIVEKTITTKRTRPLLNVVYVDLPKHRLWGCDNYWVKGKRSYGMFNDEENWPSYLGLAQAVAWLNRQMVTGEAALPPDGVTVHRGIMIPDWAARQVGLL